MSIEAIGEIVTKLADSTVEISKSAAEISAHVAEKSEEFAEGQIGEIRSQREIIIEPDMVTIKELSLKSVIASNSEGLYRNAGEGIAKGAEDIHELRDVPLEKAKLTDEEKTLIIKETGWPPEVADCIESMEQYEIYKEAKLHYAEIDGRPCLIKDIDMDYVDPKSGLTNRELMEKGRSPIDTATGEKIELHHMGQDFNSPFAELCENSEHGDGKDGILHDKKVESWRNDPAKLNEYNNHQRPEHWEARATEV